MHSRCARVAKQESRSHTVGECEIHKEERDVLEEMMRGVDECDMEEFGTLRQQRENDRNRRR